MSTRRYTLDNGNSLTYADLMEILCIKLTSSHNEWLDMLRLALEEEDRIPPAYPNPLRALYGALRAGSPLFGSTACRLHMDMLASCGLSCPPVTLGLLRVYLTRFHEEGALPAIL